MKNPTALVQWCLIPYVTSGSCIKGGSAQGSSLAHRHIQTLLPAAPEVRLVLLILFLLLLLLLEEKLALGAMVSTWEWAHNIVLSATAGGTLWEWHQEHQVQGQRQQGLVKRH